MNRTRLMPIAIAVAALAAPAAASADSIVYRDDGAIWVAAPDGSQKSRISGAEYWSPSQADDGTIAVARPGGIDVIGRDAQVLRSIDTAPVRAGNGGWHDGTPSEVAISPDGRLAAYEFSDIACPAEGGPCLLGHTVLYTSTAGPKATDPSVYGIQYNRETPQFLTNDRVLLSGGSGAWASFDTVGGGDSSSEGWLTDTGQITHGSISRDGKHFAGRFSYGEDATIGMLAVDGDPRTGVPARPTPEDSVCVTGPNEKNERSSWAPDGMGLAYESELGVEVVRFSSFARGDCGVASSTVLSPTAEHPSWGPAGPAVPAPASAGGSGTQTAATTPGAGSGPAAATKPRVAAVKATARALRKGLKVQVTLPAAGRVTVTLARGKRTVAKRSRSAPAGTTTVRLPKVGAKAARRLRGKRLTLTVAGPGGTVARTLRAR